MKKLLTHLTVALSLIVWFGTNVEAEPSSKTLTVSMTEEGIDIWEENPKGFRMPSSPIICTVDFASLSVSSHRIPMVRSYELWDETGDAVIVSYSSDYEMVSFMASQNGCFQLRLVTAESAYIGYIEL